MELTADFNAAFSKSIKKQKTTLLSVLILGLLSTGKWSFRKE